MELETNMAKTKTHAEVPAKALLGPMIQKQPTTPEKQTGSWPTTDTTTAMLPPPQGEPATTRAADLMMAPAQGVSNSNRARIMTSMQRTVGNARLSRLLNPTVQTKLTVGAPNDLYEQEADRVADTVMRMPEPRIVEKADVSQNAQPFRLQRLCPVCQKKLQRQPMDENEEQNPSSAEPKCTEAVCPECEEKLQRQPMEEDQEEEPLQAKEAPGDTPEVTSEMESYLNTSRGGGQPLAESTRRSMEPRFGSDFSGVRVHTDSRAVGAARDLNAQAFTTGQDIYFGTGRYQSGTPPGQRLLAHELTHVVQQSGGRLQRAQTQDKKAVVQGDASVLVQRQFGGGGFGGGGAGGDFDDYLPDLPDPGELLNEAWESATNVVSDIWDRATALARALAGSVSLSGSKIVVEAPTLSVCPTLPISFNLPQLSTNVPLFSGALPITSTIFAQGTAVLHAGFTPSVDITAGPCLLRGLRIEIDPFSGVMHASANLDVDAAVSLVEQAQAGLRGDIALLAIIPAAIPIVLRAPVAALEAGFAGIGAGGAGTSIRLFGSFSYANGQLSLVAAGNQVIAIDVGFGLAGYGAIELAGVDVCNLYWPLVAWQDGFLVEMSFSAAANVGVGGAFATLTIRPPVVTGIDTGPLPANLIETMQTDDCPLCPALYEAGLMPSQRGGVWSGHPGGAWGSGPEEVFPRDRADNGIQNAAASLCRGACGWDCSACKPGEMSACETVTEEGSDFPYHRFWVYPEFASCGTHDACRQHDACYDWASAHGESFIGPNHRLCDLEIACKHGLENGIMWAIGKGPTDGTMPFSNKPRISTGCRGACPEDGRGQPGRRKYRIRLDDVPLFDAMSKNAELFDEAVDVPVWTGALPPPASFITVHLKAFAGLNARTDAALGPGKITGLIFEVDPFAGTYIGQGSIEIVGMANLYVVVEGGLELAGRILGVVPLASAPAMVRGDAVASARGVFLATAGIDFHCNRGEPGFNTRADLSLDTCLGLSFKVDGGISLEVLGLFRVFTLSWDLAAFQWQECLRLGSSVAPLSLKNEVGDDVVNLTIPTMKAAEFLKAAFTNDPETDQEPSRLPERLTGKELPILWPRQLPRPPDNPHLVRVSGTERDFEGLTRGRAQDDLYQEIRRNRGVLPPPRPCPNNPGDTVNDESLWNDPYDAHHIHPLFLGGRDIPSNLCALRADLHQQGHPKLYEQNSLIDYYREAGINAGNLKQHPDWTEYFILGDK
jgi:hypothetical protein